ncbi:MAG TPA: hypothetical protein VGG27_14950 [Magnetospirillaceae bacterium]|jgi:hypothetical protein
MTTVQFAQSVLDWLLADPTHIVTAASMIAALTPSPNPNSVAGKFYRVVDILALNILRAKDMAGDITNAAPLVASNGMSVILPASDVTKGKQAGFSSGMMPTVVMVAVGLVSLAALGGCSEVQTAFTQANTQVVHAEMGAGKDEISVGRELICGAPYQVVANSMADDMAGLGTAVPALCPATKAVAVALPTTTPSATPSTK